MELPELPGPVPPYLSPHDSWPEQIYRPRSLWRRILSVGFICFGVVAIVSLVSEAVFTNGIINRMFLSQADLAENEAQANMLSHIIFQKIQIGCPASNMSADDRARWGRYADSKGWPPYPSAGADCRDP